LHQLNGNTLGTLVSPYCSGLGNLIFVYLAIHRGIPDEVLTNCLTNNWTNLTLVLAIPALLPPENFTLTHFVSPNLT
jgi:cation:H+ antiporter